MSRSVDLAIELSTENAAIYRTMATRIREVRMVDDVQSCSALITENAESAARALERRKHVLVVDPFSLSTQRQSDFHSCGRAMAGLLGRFQPSIFQVKHAVDKGKLGAPGLLRVHRWQSDSDRSDNLLAGELDLALWLFADRPTEIFAIERPGYVQTHLGFSRGGMAIIDIDTSTHLAGPYYSLSLIGSSGAAYADDHHNVNLLIDDQRMSALVTSQGDVAITQMIEVFVASIRDGRPPSPNFGDTAEAIRIAREVRSAASQQRVMVSGRVDHG